MSYEVFFFIQVSLNHLHYCVNEIETNWNKFFFLLSVNSTNFVKICKNSPNFLYHKIINNFIKKEKPLVMNVVMGLVFWLVFFPFSFLKKCLKVYTLDIYIYMNTYIANLYVYVASSFHVRFPFFVSRQKCELAHKLVSKNALKLARAGWLACTLRTIVSWLQCFAKGMVVRNSPSLPANVVWFIWFNGCFKFPFSFLVVLCFLLKNPPEVDLGWRRI
jgi:hypothetical protein